MSTLAEQFMAEFTALAKDQQPVVLQLSKLQVWVLFSHLQLALRHPENTGPSAKIARQIACGLRNLIATTPALQQVAAMGWSEDVSLESLNAIHS